MDPIAGCGPACPVVWEGRQAQSCRLDPISNSAEVTQRFVSTHHLEQRAVVEDKAPGSHGVSDPPEVFPREHFGSNLPRFSFGSRVQATTKRRTLSTSTIIIPPVF